MKKASCIISIFIILGCLQTAASASTNQKAIMNATTASQTSNNENTQQKQINSIKQKNINQNRKIANRDQDKRRPWKVGDLSPSQVKKLQQSNSK